MANKSRNLYRGILIPDGDMSRVWEAETTVDEAGNRAGIPSTDSKTEMVLEASGHQDDSGEGRKLEVLSLRGGYPGPGEAGYGWRQSAESVQDWRGWDVPAAIASWQNVDYNTNSDFNLHPDLINITRVDGSDYMLTAYEFVSGSNIRVALRKRVGDTWGAQTIAYVETGYVTGRYLHPTLLSLPTGRVLLFNVVYDHLNSIAQIQMQYSDDEGATWTVGADYTLPEPISTVTQEVKKIRCAFKDGQILLVAHVTDTSTPNDDLIVQFASDDFGTSFLKVFEFSGIDGPNSGGLPDVAASGGFFIVTWITKDGLRPAVNRLGSAYEPLIPTTLYLPVIVDPWASLLGTGQSMFGSLTIAADRDGVVYIFGTAEPDAQGIGLVIRSYDGGENWSGVGAGAGGSFALGRWWGIGSPATGGPSVQPIDYTAEFHRGRAVIVHRYQNVATQDPVGRNSLCFFYLGGFTTVCLPGLELFKRDVKRVGLPVTWVPFALPTVGIWTFSTVGAGIVEQIQSPGVLRLSCPVGSRKHYIISPAEGSTSGTVRFQDGFLGRFTCATIAAPSLQMLYARVWTSSGGGIFGELRILLRDNQIEIQDGVTSAILAAVPNAVNDIKQIFWGVRGLTDGDNATGAECAVWVRDWDVNEDRVWTLVYQGPLTIAGGGTTSFVHWGDREVPPPSDVLWNEFHVTYGKQTAGQLFPFVGYHIAQGQANPDDLFPRNYSTVPLYVDSDTRIAAIDGPTFEGDTWEIDVRHLQDKNNALCTVSPSPAKTWRSKTASAGDTIAFQRNPDGEDAYGANDIYAIHFRNINFKRAQLQVKRAGSWVNVGTINFFLEYNFRRYGHSIKPVGEGDAFYAYYNEFKGLKFEFNPDSQSSEVATILRNSEGMAYNTNNTKPSTVFLDPDTFDHTTAPNFGTAHIWFKDMTYIIHGAVGASAIEGIRLQLCNTGTLPPEGYYEAGVICPGPVAIFGWDYSRERNLQKRPNVDLQTLRDGTRHAYKSGETRSRVRFSWASGVDVSQLRDEWTAPDGPDYVRTSGGLGNGEALRQDGPLLSWGLIDRLEGSITPIVYLPRIVYSQRGNPIVDPRQKDRGSIYGRLVSPIILETVVGDEEETEVYRVNTIVIEEEV